jgi:nicotinic acid mononucleotide adenylyltransferase
MKNYRQLVKELPSKKVVFAFGRFQPPTTGHELLVNAVKKLAGTTADHVIYASKTEDKKSNPLPVARKVYFLKRMFPKTNFLAASAEVRTPIEAAKELNKKYKNIVLVAGSDRVASFQKLLNDYNGKEYHFDTIEVVSAGERDPDSDTASGMSGTKMREAAVAGDFNKFKKGLPHTLTELDGRRLMNDIRKGLGHPIIKEQFIVQKDNLREKYFNGEIFNVGDIVESSDIQYEIVKRGSNHLLLKQENGSLVSKWIQNVTLVEEIKMNEELSDKTIKGSDKIKVARIIANTFGVENAEATSDPTQLVNSGLRKVRGKAFNADSLKIIGKMLELAREVGIQYDNNLVPTKLKEGTIQPNETDKIDVLSSAPTDRTKTVYYKDFKKMLQKEAIVDKKDNESDQDTEARAKAHPHTEVGHAMAAIGDTSNVRRQKIKYRLGEEVELDESVSELDKHVSTFGKGVKSSAAKQSTYKRDGKPIHNMKHVETDSDHHAVFKHLQKMGYKKTSGYDPKPHEFDMHHNRDEMTSKSDPVHHSSGVSAHVEKEHGGKTKVHFTHRGMKEEVQLDESYEKAEAHRTKAVEAQKKGDAEKFHHHMSNHYEALSQWHSSKGRHNMADLTSQKADKHHEASLNGGKLKTEEVTEEPAMKHRVAVTVSDPNHTAVSKRKDQMQKFAKVTAASMEDAIKKAEAHFKKSGFKIHGSEHHSMVKEDLNELSNDTLGSYKKKAGAEASAADKAGDTKKADKRFSGIIKATKKEFVNDLRKEESYYTKVVDALNEAMTAIDKGEYDFEGQMARTQLQTTMRNCKDLIDMVKDDDNMPEWVQSKITLAQDYITTVRDYLQSKEELGEETKAELEKDKDYQEPRDPFFEDHEEEMSDADMDAMINNTQDHEFLDAYEDDELHIIDLDTGEPVEDDTEHVKEEALMEVLSRFERLRAKMRFAKTKSKRERRMAIALKSRSSTQTLNKRARHMAVILMKKRIARKPLSQLSIGEKERLDKIIQKRKVMIGRIAMKLTPRMRKIEQNRLSHTKGGTGNTSNAF